MLVGLAATGSPALMIRLDRHRSPVHLLLAALIVQAAGIALPVLVSGTIAALIAGPLLNHGYHLVLLVASVIVLLGAVATGGLSSRPATGCRTPREPRRSSAGA